MEIIMLRGGHSCGKTSTLNIVNNELCKLGAVSTCRKKEGGDPNDFSDILLYKGKRIAMFTMGDFSDAVVNAMRNYNALGVDMLICACNARFANPMKEIVKYPHNIINKAVTPVIGNQSAVNIADATTIISLI